MPAAGSGVSSWLGNAVSSGMVLSSIVGSTEVAGSWARPLSNRLHDKRSKARKPAKKIALEGARRAA